MTVLERLTNSIVVPVVVLDNAADAVPTAEAMLAGGVDVMEITFRTAAAPDAIRAVSEGCPDMLVGAGTVLTPEQLERADINGNGKADANDYLIIRRISFSVLVSLLF